jgi:hypothetical protein
MRAHEGQGLTAPEARGVAPDGMLAAPPAGEGARTAGITRAADGLRSLPQSWQCFDSGSFSRPQKAHFVTRSGLGTRGGWLGEL